MADDKTVSKTASKTAKPSPRSGYALPLGNHPKNTGGKKGRSGPRPQEFTKVLGDLRRDPAVHARLKKALTNADDKGFASALKLLADYDLDRPASKSDVTSKGEQITGVVILPAAEDK